MEFEQKIETETNEDIEKEIYECFSLFDTNKCGYIDIREFYFALKSLGLNFKKEKVKKLFLEIKNNLHDKLTFDEFFDIASKHINTRYNDEEANSMFSLFDPYDTGKITLASLKEVCKEIGEEIEESELIRMIEYADKNNDKAIDKNEFKNVLFTKWKNEQLSDLDSD
ncbi:centrin-4, putative [Plasmodium yoelii]|uniref:non-specific serine/threonine protein kinase n=2 Tax=Plasmodium yoelii TaxID=5861 RepID=A0AAF0B2N4_PLAYO|nr:centrin-4, putative [Plasmodium yoelii]WBY57598.1 centrin-4 [Plasmodium yoelii yoelii]VTZ78623.1 centrin-4, putative [Plasmodium yoelii]|eukprot:XP_022812286.1 centrin-4, putative [Plasmodium yoelii]